MEVYWLSGKRDCLIISVEEYDNGRNRSNAQNDAHRLQKTFQGLNFQCQVRIKLNTMSTVTTAGNG